MDLNIFFGIAGGILSSKVIELAVGKWYEGYNDRKKLKLQASIDAEVRREQDERLAHLENEKRRDEAYKNNPIIKCLRSFVNPRYTVPYVADKKD